MAFWPYSVDTYQLFRVLLENPRIRKTQISRKFNVNPKTGEVWLDAAIEKRIIVPPVFRRKSFLNFREYFYFLQAKHPHQLYEELQKEKGISYFSVQTGFANFQVITEKPRDFRAAVVLQGPRSDYFVTTPPPITYEGAIVQLEKKLQNLNDLKDSLTDQPSPLRYHDSVYEWDEAYEHIYRQFCNDYRRNIVEVLKNTGTYKDKVMEWIKKKDQFGDVIIMYFPQGESSYLLSLYYIETDHDALLLNMFSSLPVSTVFYRIGEKLIMCVYLPHSAGGTRYIIRKTLELLWKKELVHDYTNSIVEYHYRPDI